MSLLEATQQQFVWKDAEVKAFAIALLQAALRLPAGAEFTTDLVEKRGDGRGIAGSVTNALCNASLLSAVGAFHGEVFCHKAIKSPRPGANARKIGVYRLPDPGLAKAFLKRQGAEFDPVLPSAPALTMEIEGPTL